MRSALHKGLLLDVYTHYWIQKRDLSPNEWRTMRTDVDAILSCAIKIAFHRDFDANAAPVARHPLGLRAEQESDRLYVLLLKQKAGISCEIPASGGRKRPEAISPFASRLG